MNLEHLRRDDSLSLADILEINRICDRADADWRAGVRPAIEAMILAIRGPARSALLRELLAVELEYRLSSGETTHRAEYLARFPGDATVIEAAFAALDGPTAGPSSGRPEHSTLPHREVPDGERTAPEGEGFHAGAMRARTIDDEPAGGPAGAGPDGPRYRRTSLHDQGGLGLVFRAWDRELGREVALKEVRDATAPDEVLARFTREAELTGRLEHPGIIPVYGLGYYGDGRPFYAMRFIRGGSLKQAIAAFHHEGAANPDRGARALALQKLLRRFLDVCNAIAYAHSRGVLHRDIKPENVMLGPFGETLVVDWGLAKELDRGPVGRPPGEVGDPDGPIAAGATLPGSVLGTPAYMSPEQAAGQLDRLTPASDVYSLGATLYSILTGKAPFRGPHLALVLEQVRRGDFPAPRSVDPSVDRSLDAVCLKAMAPAPGDRYQSARALADDVERWLADEPVSARREPLADRLTRWSRRHRTAVVGVSALILATAATLSIAAGSMATSAARAESAAAREKSAYQEKSHQQGVASLQIARADSRLLRLIEMNTRLLRPMAARWTVDRPGQREALVEFLGRARDLAMDTARELEHDREIRRSQADPEGSSNRSIQEDAISAPEQQFEGLIRQYAGEIREARIQLGHYNEAVPDLASIVARDEAAAGRRDPMAILANFQMKPQLADDLIKLGRVLVAAGRPDEAARPCGRAIEIVRAARPMNETQVAFMALRNKPGSETMDYSIRMSVTAADRSIQLATLLRSLGRADEATEFFRSGRVILESILKVDPKRAGPRTGLAWLLACCPDTSVADPAEAARIASDVVDSGVVSPSALVVLAAALGEAGRPSEAISAANRSIRARSEQDGGNVEAWLILAMAEGKRGRKAEARRWFDIASRWIEANGSGTFEVRMLRDKAASLLRR